MVQPEDVAAAVVFCATLPPRSCISELTIVPTDNNFYRADAQAIAARS
jgi:NADP-dependent 3-hydroxy acid dehydrogenase YdfG